MANPITDADIGLIGNERMPAEVLAQLVREWRQAVTPGPDQDVGLASERLRAIQLAGAVAATFGGRESQQFLFEQVEFIDRASAGALTHLWDHVGEWLS